MHQIVARHSNRVTQVPLCSIKELWLHTNHTRATYTTNNNSQQGVSQEIVIREWDYKGHTD